MTACVVTWLRGYMTKHFFLLHCNIQNRGHQFLFPTTPEPSTEPAQEVLADVLHGAESTQQGQADLVPFLYRREKTGGDAWGTSWDTKWVRNRTGLELRTGFPPHTTLYLSLHPRTGSILSMPPLWEAPRPPFKASFMGLSCAEPVFSWRTANWCFFPGGATWAGAAFCLGAHPPWPMSTWGQLRCPPGWLAQRPLLKCFPHHTTWPCKDPL